MNKKEYNLNYKTKHKSELIIKNKAYYEKNKELIHKKIKKWRKCNKNKLKEYNAAHKSYYLEHTRSHRNKIRFKGQRVIALERDNWSCVKCGMNNEQHITVFGRQITVDHIDNNEINCDLSNLQTLCLRCHGKKDAIKRVYAKKNN